MQPADRKIDAARAMLTHLATHLQADLSAELWNGEIVPLGTNARSDIRLCIRTPDVIRRLVLQPSLLTFFRLYSESAIDVTGGSPRDAARRWDHQKAVALSKKVDKWFLLKQAWPFLFGASTPASAAPGYEKPVGAAYGSSRKDQEMIQFHYDVSNEFFAQFLDPEMVYSCAYFADAGQSLEKAQIHKLDTICRKLHLQPGDKLLDIGCGWGGLACHAARHYGAIVHGVTLSQAQFDFATAKIARLGLQDRIRIELRDYRSIDTPEYYDKIAQIEMFEHIGIDNHDIHFRQMHRLLRPRGLYLHQASTRPATLDLSQFRTPTAYRNIITKYIFPGGELDYIGLTTTNLERHRLEVIDVECLREHFQRTLEMWIARLYDNRETAAGLAGSGRTRMWLLYFSLFAIGFDRGTVSVYQTLACKRRTGPTGLPLDRAHLYS